MMLQPGDYVWRRGRIIDDAVEACTEPDTGAIELGRYVEGDSWWIADADGGLGELDPNSAPVIPDVPNLAHIARYLAEHPETVDALEVAAATARYMESVLPSSLPERRDAADVVKGLIAAMRGEGGE